MYEVVLSRDAARALGRLTPNMRARVFKALEQVGANPLAGKRLRGELEGLFGLRIGGMRAVYEVDSLQEVVIVHAIGSRGDIYKR
ncbi:MAG: type II toxin-antitoxin system RelE/ParE family toxin [Dehalococcoidia bacterium]|nr:type II toxin-antitoxin system RelE/ParE family toxin [Dehalococcoidia bacterium]